mmetsp:Transcript_75649/g.221774  ORF Transcript_75649/g.221774 Transcript_75649/m.221774 type:complete len:371 (-) Transcript_75649:120-1232(-)
MQGPRRRGRPQAPARLPTTGGAGPPGDPPAGQPCVGCPPAGAACLGCREPGPGCCGGTPALRNGGQPQFHDQHLRHGRVHGGCSEAEGAGLHADHCRAAQSSIPASRRSRTRLRCTGPRRRAAHARRPRQLRGDPGLPPAAPDPAAPGPPRRQHPGAGRRPGAVAAFGGLPAPGRAVPGRERAVELRGVAGLHRLAAAQCAAQGPGPVGDPRAGPAQHPASSAPAGPDSPPARRLRRPPERLRRGSPGRAPRVGSAGPGRLPWTGGALCRRGRSCRRGGRGRRQGGSGPAAGGRLRAPALAGRGPHGLWGAPGGHSPRPQGPRALRPGRALRLGHLRWLCRAPPHPALRAASGSCLWIFTLGTDLLGSGP